MAIENHVYARVSYTNDGAIWSDDYIVVRATATSGIVSVDSPTAFSSGTKTIKPSSWTITGQGRTYTVTAGNQANVRVSSTDSITFNDTGGDIISGYVPYTGTATTTSCKYYATLKFNTNGGSSLSNRSSNVNATSATSITFSNVGSTSKSGVTFKGWSTSSSSNTISYASTASYTFSFTPNYNDQSKSATLYAVWGITQSFNANGGSFGSSTAWNSTTKNSQSPGDGVSFTIPANGPTQSGKVFVGWAKSSTATNPVVNQSTSAQTVTLTSTTTWYAVWRNSTQITQHFDPNGGNTLKSVYADVTKTVAEGGSASFTIPAFSTSNGPTHSDSNMYFLGWSANAWATTPYINRSTSSQSVTLSNNKTWYAVWWDEAITQSFDANGGTFGSSTAWNAVTKSRPHGGSTTVSFTVPAGGPTRRGFKFLGWSSSPTALTPYLVVSTSTQTVSLSKDRVWYAVWGPAPVYIKLNGTIYEAYAYICKDDGSGNLEVTQTCPYVKTS